MPYTPMQLANSFIKTGEFTDALDALNAQLVQVPHDDEALRLRAQVLARMDNPSQALIDITAVLAPTSDDQFVKSVLYERMSDMPNAIASLNVNEPRHAERLVYLLGIQENWHRVLEVIKAQPPSWRWQQYEADTLVKMGRDNEALVCYEGVLQALAVVTLQSSQKGVFTAMTARILMAQAFIFLRLAQYDEVEARLQRASQYIPDDPAIGFNMGIIWVHRGDLAKAIAYAKEALLNASLDVKAHLLQSLHDDPRLSALRDALE